MPAYAPLARPAAARRISAARRLVAALVAASVVVAACGGAGGGSGGEATARAAATGMAAATAAGASAGPAAASPMPATASAEVASTASSQGGSDSAANGVPAFRHVYLLVLENEEFSSLVGAGAAPYLNSLVRRYALASGYFAVAHPSQPNYIALFSGSTQGVTTDGDYDLPGQNLADQLEAKGRTWAVFEQGYPGDCFRGANAAGVTDGPGSAGEYARKHNPAISFTDISGNPARCARIGGLAAFDPAAADFEMIVPNLCNDMHNCSIATGDAFLAAFVPRIIASPAFAGSVLFITTDEGSSSQGGGGRVATIVVSSLVKSGFVSATRHDHYSLLRTIEEAWGLGCLASACSANTLAEFFR